MNRLMLFAALSGAMAVAAGAFGAHGVEGQAADWLRTGAAYQLVHAVAGLALMAKRQYGPAEVMLGGAAIFAITLYAMAFGAPRWLGAVTPIGGALMIGGWLWLAYRASLSRNASTSARDTDLST
jgi:uncharacterized membrane protein YgdD (TMEM256/DUF423 family)